MTAITVETYDEQEAYWEGLADAMQPTHQPTYEVLEERIRVLESLLRDKGIAVTYFGSAVLTSDVPLCAAHADPHILEQAYEQDEAALDEGECCIFCGPQFFHDNPICPQYDTRYDPCDTCDQSPCTCDDEPPDAALITGYDNGPTYW